MSVFPLHGILLKINVGSGLARSKRVAERPASKIEELKGRTALCADQRAWIDGDYL